MKKIYIPLLAVFATIFTYGQTPCENGFALNYPCNGFDLQSHISLDEMDASEGNDSWGWTDPEDGTEYALVGLDNGTAFINISDPVNPIYLGKLPTHTSATIWRDIKVYQDHAFIVSEAGGHGMQVFDLTRLRTVAAPPETFTEDAHYAGFGASHNIVINEETGYAFSVGDNTFGGGPHMINIQDPLNPFLEGGYSAGGYTHDAQVIVYDGPDNDYTGKEIFFGSNEDHVEIVDITDKSNPIQIASVSYPSVDYTHQSWLTDDRKYLLLGDEGDEFDFGFNTRTVVFNVSDLDNIQVHMEYFSETSSVDHNGYVIGDRYYLSNYSSGLRVVDISNIENQEMTADIYFDTYPQNNNANYDGSWNVYPFFESQNIVITGTNGFTLVRESGLNNTDFKTNDFNLIPNPAKNNLRVQSNNSPISKIEIFNVLGQRVINTDSDNLLSKNIDISSLNVGIYLVKINSLTTKRLIVK